MKPNAIRLIADSLKAATSGGPLPEPEEFDPDPPPPVALSPELKFQLGLSSAGVPPMYRQVPATLNLHPAAAEWRGDPVFLTFLGAVGSGKTWQATRLFGDLRQEGWAGLWIDATEAVEHIRKEIATDYDGRTMERMMEVEVLLLDDFLAERQDSEFAHDKLSLILRHRYNHMYATIVTTNSVDAKGQASLEGIAKREPRLASRIGEGLVIKLTGKDRRLK